MLKIAICDDDEKDRMAVNEVLMKIKYDMAIDFDIKYFSSGEDLCNDIKGNSYDILLLDIQMNGIDGIETAKQIRSYGEKSKIVFTSSYDERVKELFRVDTVDFIDKPVTEDRLKNAFEVIIESLSDKISIFEYTHNRIQYQINQDDILYFESSNHKITIVTKADRIEISESLKWVWEQLSSSKLFAIVNRSYIINFNYVNEISNTKVLMNDDVDISISRNHKEELLKKYMKFIRGV